MERVFLLLILTAALLAGQSTDTYAEREENAPCDLSAGSCTRELELGGFEGPPQRSLTWVLHLEPPTSFHGILEWKVSLWDGRKWGSETVLTYAPWNREQTTVSLFRETLVRVRVAMVPATGAPPGADVAIVASATIPKSYRK